MYTCYIKAQENQGQYLVYFNDSILRQVKFRLLGTVLSEYLVLIDLLTYFWDSGLESQPITIYTESKKMVDQLAEKKDVDEVLHYFWVAAKELIERVSQYGEVSIVYDKEKVNVLLRN